MSLSPEPQPSYSYSYETESESGEPGPASTVKPAAVPCFDSEASGSVCRNASNLFVKYDYRRAALADMTEEVDDGVIRAIMPRLLALPPRLQVYHGTVKKRAKEDSDIEWPATLVLPQPQFWVGNIKAAEKPEIHRDIGYRALWTVADITVRGRVLGKGSRVICMNRIDANAVVEGSISFEFCGGVVEVRQPFGNGWLCYDTLPSGLEPLGHRCMRLSYRQVPDLSYKCFEALAVGAPYR